MKVQSAVEYLMTYGWSILIIAVVIASLIELGVFNSVNSSPSSCIGVTGYSCSNPTLYASGALVTKLGQVSTGTITITGTACTKNSTVTSITPVASTQLQSEQQSQIIFHCPIASNVTGTQFTGHLWIEYSTSAQQNIIQEVGVVQTPVVSANAAAYTPVIYVVNFNGGSGNGNVIEFNTNGQYLRSIDYSEFNYLQGIAISGSTVYVLSSGAGSILGNIIEFNTDGQSLGAINSATFNNPDGLAILGTTIYVVNNGYLAIGNIIEFNTNTGNTVTGAIDSPEFQYPTDIAASGSTLYVTNEGGGTAGMGNIIEFNTNTGNTVIGAIDSPTFSDPVALAISGSTIYVLNQQGGTNYGGNIIEFNTNTGNTVIGAIDSPAFSDPFTFALSGTTIYVANSHGGSGVGIGNIIEFNTNTGNMVIGAIVSPEFDRPQNIAIYTPITP